MKLPQVLLATDKVYGFGLVEQHADLGLRQVGSPFAEQGPDTQPLASAT